VGEASGRVGEHWGIAAELMDVQAASDDGQSRLSMWRPLVAAVQRGTDVDGAARRPLASEVVGARARPEEASTDRFEVGVDRLAAAHMAYMVASFLGATAARGVEAGLHGRRRRCPRRGCSSTRARWFGASAVTTASRARHAVQSGAGA
jgi:hypothetical protein